MEVRTPFTPPLLVSVALSGHCLVANYKDCNTGFLLLSVLQVRLVGATRKRVSSKLLTEVSGLAKAIAPGPYLFAKV